MALRRFREERMQEPLEAYLEAFDNYRAVFEDLLEMTIDLSQLVDVAVDMVTNSDLLEAVRYLVHDQETFWAMNKVALRALTMNLAVPLGQLVSDTRIHYPEPVLNLH